MFCEEKTEEVYECWPDYVTWHPEHFFDCYHDLALHLTKGYRLILKTNSYFICIGFDGVKVVPNTENIVSEDEYMEPCIHTFDYDKDAVPWVDYESTLFVGEQLFDVKQENERYILTFNDFVLKVIPHDSPDDIEGLHNKNHWSFNYVYGLDRLLSRKCDCGGKGEVLMDFVSDYVVRCSKCKKSTWAGINVIDAIDDWNNGETPCNLSDIIIE